MKPLAIVYIVKCPVKATKLSHNVSHGYERISKLRSKKVRNLKEIL